jgi:hypothetical protein
MGAEEIRVTAFLECLALGLHAFVCALGHEKRTGMMMCKDAASGLEEGHPETQTREQCLAALDSIFGWQAAYGLNRVLVMFNRGTY